MREKLPDRRTCITQELCINGTTVYFSVGLYGDGRPGELFIDMHKTGTVVRAWCGSTAKLVSLMLQYKIPLSEIVDALVGQCTEAQDKVLVEGHEVVVEASGVLDAVMRCIALDYLAQEQEEKTTISLFLDEVSGLDAAEMRQLAIDDGEEDRFSDFIERF